MVFVTLLFIQVLRNFLAPPAPDVELGTVSFRSKMDEVIKNFCQYWPIYDLPFEVVDETNKDAEGGGDSTNVPPPSDAETKPTSRSGERQNGRIDYVDAGTSPLVLPVPVYFGNSNNNGESGGEQDNGVGNGNDFSLSAVIYKMASLAQTSAVPKPRT